MVLEGKERLVAVEQEGGAREWRMERPLLAVDDLLPCAVLGGMAALLIRNVWGYGWERASLLGAGLALAVLLAQGLVEVCTETLAFTPGQGIRLEARRRCGLAGDVRTLPLRRIDDVIIHEHATPLRKTTFYLALTTKPPGGQAAGEGDMVSAELAFPNLQPRLALIRQVYQQLQPLLQAQPQGKGSAKAKAAQAAPKPAEQKKGE